MSHIRKFLSGGTLGLIFGWWVDKSAFDEYYKLLWPDREIKEDNLSRIDPNLSIEERRKIFMQNLLKYGPSIKLQYMITDFNYNLILNNSSANFSQKSELDLLEDQFRKYYPELFDQAPGHEFIISLNLKTKCNDHNIPKVLKPRYGSG